MNCNKVKELKLTIEDVVKSVKDSDQVEVDADNKKIRRKDNKALPPKSENAQKKRESKAHDKEEQKTTK
jgi:hypothetical protein